MTLVHHWKFSATLGANVILRNRMIQNNNGTDAMPVVDNFHQFCASIVNRYDPA